jgi:hypothetical protein
VKLVCKCVSEKDVNKMNSMHEKNKAYGFVDNPPILHDIIRIVDQLFKDGEGHYNLDDIVNKVTELRQMMKL